MNMHRIETTLQKDGTLTLDGLPFHAGETVEVIVLPKATPRNIGAYLLRGTPVTYTAPFEPVASDEWEASK